MASNPTEADIVRMIERLDGKIYSTIVLKSHQGTELLIGGGNGKYVISAARGDQFCADLIADVRPTTERILLNIGGQDGDYPAEQVVDEKVATACAFTFLKTGELDSRFKWRKS